MHSRYLTKLKQFIRIGRHRILANDRDMLLWGGVTLIGIHSLWDTLLTKPAIFVVLKVLKTTFWEGRRVIYLESPAVFAKVAAGLDEITEIF